MFSEPVVSNGFPLGGGGSYANGKASYDSDIDIFVIKDSELPRPQRTMQLRRMLFGSRVPMDLIVYTPNEIEIEKDEKYSFVYEVLNPEKQRRIITVLFSLSKGQK